MAVKKSRSKTTHSIITVRPSSKADLKIIDDIKAHFGLSTATKALMEAAAKYPALANQNDELETTLRNTEYRLQRLESLVAEKFSVDEQLKDFISK